MTELIPPKNLRVAILGCGFIGTAFLSGIIKTTKESQPGLKFSASVQSQTSLQRLQQQFSSHSDQVDCISTNNARIAHPAEVVVLAFQPQQLSDILNNRSLFEAIKDKLIISMIAGVTVRQIRQMMDGFLEPGQSLRISRVIPSIGALINESMSLIANTSLSQLDRGIVTWLFQQVGQTQVVSEQAISTVTAVSAACHALTVVATDAIVDASVAEGVPRPQALEVAAQCLRSSASVLQGHMTIENLKDSMSIAQGITINALLQLDRGQVRSGISDAVRHAVRYSHGLSEKE